VQIIEEKEGRRKIMIKNYKVKTKEELILTN